MLVLMVTLMGLLATKMAYQLSVTRGAHRRAKRGVWDYGHRRMGEERRGDVTWIGPNLGHGSSSLA
jgi:hypothetical protein